MNTTCIVICSFMTLVIIVGAILALRSNLLRDDVYDSDGGKAFLDNAYKNPSFTGKPLDKIPRPFSLSRTQIFVWTIVIVGCYLYLQFCKACNICTNSIDI